MIVADLATRAAGLVADLRSKAHSLDHPAAGPSRMSTGLRASADVIEEQDHEIVRLRRAMALAVDQLRSNHLIWNVATDLQAALDKDLHDD